MLNLNSATTEQIDDIALLKGHGYEIVRYRAERGGFTDLRQIEEVPGLAGKIEGVEVFATVAPHKTS